VKTTKNTDEPVFVSGTASSNYRRDLADEVHIRQTTILTGLTLGEELSTFDAYVLHNASRFYAWARSAKDREQARVWGQHEEDEVQTWHDILNGNSLTMPTIFLIFEDEETSAMFDCPKECLVWRKETFSLARKRLWSVIAQVNKADFLAWCERKGVPSTSAYVAGRFLVRTVNEVTSALIDGKAGTIMEPHTDPGGPYLPSVEKPVKRWRQKHKEFASRCIAQPDLGAAHIGAVHCLLHREKDFSSGMEFVDKRAEALARNKKK